MCRTKDCTSSIPSGRTYGQAGSQGTPRLCVESRLSCRGCSALRRNAPGQTVQHHLQDDRYEARMLRVLSFGFHTSRLMHQGRSSALAPAFAHLCVAERAAVRLLKLCPKRLLDSGFWRSMTITCQYSSVYPALHDAVATDGLESVGSGELSGSPDMEPCTRLPMLLPAGMPGNSPVAFFFHRLAR